MAKIEYIAPINSITGKLGGSVFQKNKSGYIIRSKEYGSKKSTGIQNLERNKFSQLKKEWSTLTAENRGLWNDFADIHTHIDKYAKELTLTGFQWFMSINRNAVTDGSVFLSAPPAYLLPTASPKYTIEITETNISLILTAPVEILDTDLLIFTTPPIQRTSGQTRRQYRLTKILKAGTYDTISILGDWISTHGVNYPLQSKYWNFSVFAQIIPIHNTTFINGLSRNINTSFFSSTVGFSPLDIADCKLWLDGTSMVQAGNLISEWTDKSGNNNTFTQATEAYKPAYIPTGLNNKPTARFNGTNNFLNGGNILNMGIDDWSVFFVTKSNKINTGIFSKRIPYIFDNTFFLSATGSGWYSYNWAFAKYLVLGDAPHNMSIFNILNYFTDRGNSKAYEYVANALLWTFDMPNPTCNQTGVSDCIIGNWVEVNAYFEGDIAEIIIYNRCLTAPERTQVYDYLHKTFFE
jgi:hypothetical protein